MSHGNSPDNEAYDVVVYEHETGQRSDSVQGGTYEHHYKVNDHEFEGPFFVLYNIDGSKKVYPEHTIVSVEIDSS